MCPDNEGDARFASGVRAMRSCAGRAALRARDAASLRLQRAGADARYRGVSPDLGARDGGLWRQRRLKWKWKWKGGDWQYAVSADGPVPASDFTLRGRGAPHRDLQQTKHAPSSLRGEAPSALAWVIALPSTLELKRWCCSPSRWLPGSPRSNTCGYVGSATPTPTPAPPTPPSPVMGEGAPWGPGSIGSTGHWDWGAPRHMFFRARRSQASWVRPEACGPFRFCSYKSRVTKGTPIPCHAVSQPPNLGYSLPRPPPKRPLHRAFVPLSFASTRTAVRTVAVARSRRLIVSGGVITVL
ncbi:hypothetical protein JB92DRAFT_2825137 [Gautieria morchelliformis]|nr:hypothetical protein JB92DRAFT_2825137 [Gautieria morchelliformis]